jgi:DNA repair exonuclease SbcCD ATPase subunit
MPFNTEDLADKFGSSAEDIRNNLDGLIEKAEDADKAFENLTKRQEYAVKIQDKFATAMTASSKSMVLFGRSGNTAVRGLKAVGAISRTVASSLGSIGVGAGAAAGGFKALSSEASSFTSDISRTERSIAGFVARIGGLEKKLKGIKSASVPVEMGVGSLSALDDIEKRLKALPKNVKVNLSTVSAGAASQSNQSTKAGSSQADKDAKRAEDKRIQEENRRNREIAKNEKRLERDREAEAKKREKEAAKEQSMEQQRYGLQRELGGKTSYKSRGSDDGKTAKNKKEQIQKVRESAKYRQIEEFLDTHFDEEKALLADKKIMGLDKAVEKLISRNKDLRDEIELAMAKAEEAVEELYSPFNQLQEQAEKTAKSFKGLFKKDIAKGVVGELEDFAGGAAKSATGMMAAGLAVAYLASKLGDLAKKFADAAAGLARYKTETVSLEHTLIGISNGGLEQMRKQLDFTRGESAEFFEVVKKGVNQLGLSQGKIMEVSKAIAETFGAPVTERLRQYIDLLEAIPTIESDLKVTANIDDQAAAIFALAEAGKMEVVMDLQGAGLFGGKKEKRPGADMSNAAAKTARVTEEIQDFLTICQTHALIFCYF